MNQLYHPFRIGCVSARYHGIHLLLLTLIAAVHPSANATHLSDKVCLRCHSMATLAYRDPNTNNLRSLSVHPQKFAHSVHGKLSCDECHASDHQRYPHPQDSPQKTQTCIGCHEEQDDPQDRTYRFETIAAEYAKSIHATTDSIQVKGFSCYSCHDPHLFHASKVGEDLVKIVHDDNQVCLTCHTALRSPLRDPHAWLPNRERHWTAVRCLDCHTPLSASGHRVSHQILPAKQSNRDCINCHSQEPRLLNRLYQYRSATDVAEKGWISKAIFNDAYIVGMSRNPTLDYWGLTVLGLTLLGLLAHGFGHYKARQRARRKQT